MHGGELATRWCVEYVFDCAKGIPVERLKRNTATVPVPVNNDSRHADLLPPARTQQTKFNLYVRSDRQNHDACLDEQALQTNVSGPAQNHGMALV